MTHVKEHELSLVQVQESASSAEAAEVILGIMESKRNASSVMAQAATLSPFAKVVKVLVSSGQYSKNLLNCLGE